MVFGSRTRLETVIQMGVVRFKSVGVGVLVNGMGLVDERAARLVQGTMKVVEGVLT